MINKNTADKTRIEALSYRLEGGSDYPMLKVTLTPGKTLQVESSSIAGMEGGLEVHSRVNAIASRVVTEDNLFINRFHAQSSSGSVMIAPPLPGHILHHFLSAEHMLYLKKSAFLASTPNLTLVRLTEPPQALVSGTGLLLLQCKGTGDLWFNSYGAAHQLDVDGEIIVDADKIVAWTDGLVCRLAPLKGYRTSWFIGEGLSCHFQGQGRLWLQSRSCSALRHRAQEFHRRISHATP